MKILEMLQIKHLAGLFPGSPKVCLNKSTEGPVVLQTKFKWFLVLYP